MGLLLVALLLAQDLPSRALHPHAQGTEAALLTPEGKLLVTNGAPDRTVKVWIADTGKPLYTLADQALSVAMSPDGTRVAVGGRRLTTVWDPASGNRIHSFETGPVASVAFSGDGKSLTTASAGAIVRWDLKSGEKTLSFQPPPGTRTLAPDGSFLAVAEPDRRISLWDVATRKGTAPFAGAPRALAFSPDGARLAWCGDDRTVRLVETAAARELKQMANGCGAEPQIAWSRDGDLLAVAADAGIEVWDGKMERRLSVCKLPPLGVWTASTLSFSSDGRTLLCGGTLIAKDAPKESKVTGPLYFWKLKR